MTASVTLDVECGVKPAGAAALVFKPLSAGEFSQADRDVDALIQGLAAEQGSTLERKTDSFGYQWVIVRDPELEDQVTTVYGIGNGLTEKGFGGQLLAAAFRFSGDVYWIYGFKTGTFWPFVPTGGQQRDNARELSLKAKLERELPVEQDLSKWFALYDAPV